MASKRIQKVEVYFRCEAKLASVLSRHLLLSGVEGFAEGPSHILQRWLDAFDDIVSDLHLR